MLMGLRTVVDGTFPIRQLGFESVLDLFLQEGIILMQKLWVRLNRFGDVVNLHANVDRFSGQPRTV